MGRVEGKVAIITGGGMGMGESHSKLFASEGASVVVTDINVEAGESTVSDIVADGGKAIFVAHDVGSEEQWSSVVDKAVTTYGGIDILVNNAGIVFFSSSQKTTAEEWNKTMSVNLWGVQLGCQAVQPEMAKRGGGSIVNISSISGFVGMPNQAAYQASKGGVRQLTKAVAVDFQKDNIRCNSIHPGVIRTPILGELQDDLETTRTLLGPGAQQVTRMADPVEVSYPVLFLASDEASYVNGTELVVDNGYTAT
jgi:cyclopentanol dehydrogenase